MYPFFHIGNPIFSSCGLAEMCRHVITHLKRNDYSCIPRLDTNEIVWFRFAKNSHFGKIGVEKTPDGTLINFEFSSFGSEDENAVMRKILEAAAQKNQE